MKSLEIDKSTGMHRAHLWQIVGFTLNNTATNSYMFFMNFIAYYLTGFVGVTVVVASSLIMLMRIWDGVTDPFIGYVVDHTDTKFGKNRPFMLIGNLMLALFSFIMVHVTHRIPSAARFPAFVIFYMLYIIGYTFQCVVTKSAQTCLTNDPKQRPIFGISDGLFNAMLFGLGPMLVVALSNRAGGFNADFFHTMWIIVAPVSFIFTIIAIVSIAPKDQTKFFGIPNSPKPNFKDYWNTLSKNRAIQMLVVSASTDKLAQTVRGNGVVTVIVYGIVCGSFALSGALGVYSSVATFLMLLFGIGLVARNLGQKKGLLLGSWGGVITNALLLVLFYVFNPTTLRLPGVEGFTGFTIFTVLFLILYLLSRGFEGVAGALVITMTADCADYEVYRSKKYVPGLMGTLFSFVDKLISSLGATIVGLLCAAIGFRDQFPTLDTPFSESLKFVGLFSMFGLLVIGSLCNVIAMHFYPLTKEKMEEIQAEIARIKAESEPAA